MRQLPEPTVRPTEQLAAIRPLSRAQFPEHTIALARHLLGKIVVRELGGDRIAGRIVETEAYLPDDPACHAFRGPTPRTRSLFLAPGHAYVYLCYGTSYLLNVSSEAPGIGAGVLLRALQPLEGLDRMRRARGRCRDLDLSRGPGRLAASLSVDRRLDGIDLLAGRTLWLGEDGHEIGPIGQSVRIGLTKAADVRLRFFVAGNLYLSGPSHVNA